MVNGFVNATEIKEALIESISSSLSPVITIFKAVGIVLLIYLLFLLIKALFRWRTVSRIGKISKNVKQINEKLDILIAETKKGKAKVEKEKKKKGKNSLNK